MDQLDFRRDHNEDRPVGNAGTWNELPTINYDYFFNELGRVCEDGSAIRVGGHTPEEFFYFFSITMNPLLPTKSSGGPKLTDGNYTRV